MRIRAFFAFLAAFLAAGCRFHGPGMMGYDTWHSMYGMYGWWGWLWWIVVLVCLAVLVILAGRSGRSGAPPPEKPLDIARRRYAAGEISREEFLRIQEDLSGQKPS